MILKSGLLIFGKQSGRSLIISKNFGKIFGYALGVLIFLGKIFEKKGVYIMCTYRGESSRGVGREGVRIEA